MNEQHQGAAPSEEELRGLGFEFRVPEIEDVDVLIVDDDSTSLAFLTESLKRVGHPVRGFSSPVAALEAIRSEPPKILVTDLVMPEMSGLQLAAAARALDPDLGIILVTGYGDEATAQATIGLGIFQSINKPVERHDLTRAVQRAFLRRAADDHHRAMVEWTYAELARHADHIREVTLGTLASLINAVDARSPHFRGHSKAVALQAAAVAETMGLGDETVESIRTAGLLHDIGMIGVPDSVIQKPEALTQEEIDLVRQHCVAGADIVAPMQHLGPSTTYVLEHHERWDGSGYPHGKSGDEISLGGQIVGIAEAWTAILESRAYREGRTRQEGMEILLARQGEWFTEEVTQALVASDVGLMG